MTRPTFTRLGLAAVASTLLLSGCGSSSGDDDADGGGASGEQRLRYAYAFTPVADLSPYSDDAVTSYGAGATETLVQLDPSGAPQPMLAASWSEVDPTTWRFELEDDVSFQDGTPMDAEAVAQSLTRATEAEPLPRALTGTDLTVTADGDDAVVVTTAEPDPVLVQRLTSPEVAILSAAAYEDDANAPDPVGTGTGPYEITELDGTSGMTLDANADYWGGTPALTGVDVDFVAEGESRASALRSESVDLAQALPASTLGQLDEDQVLAVPLPRTVSVHLTADSPVFSDPGLREAAREAMSGVDLASSIYDGRADKAEGLFSPQVSTWAADRPAPDFPDAADPDGAAITLATFSDRPELGEAATALADALREAGFEVEVVVQEYGQLEEAFLDGQYDAVIMSRSYGQDTADPISYLQTDFGCEGTYNISQWCVPATDEELADAADLTDVDARNGVAVAVEDDLLSAVAVVPLVHDRTQFGVAPGLDGLAGDPWERAVITFETTLD